MELSHLKIGQIAFGLFLLVGMIWNLRVTLRDGCIGYVYGGVDRVEKPMLFRLFILIFLLLALVGLDFVVSGFMNLKPLIERLLFCCNRL